MPKYARDSAIDLDELYGALLDTHAPMRRNIRTKTDMHKVHHCEDKECGGVAPKSKCITRLHFAFCLGPVVDEDTQSSTYGEVVIHGQRFAVISPSGCAEHPYHAEYNLDLKDARNGRANYEIRWKKTFDNFKARHDANRKRDADQLRAMQMMMGVTRHQRQTMLARQNNNEYQHRRQLDIANRAMVIFNEKEHEPGVLGESGALQPAPATGPGADVEVARPQPDPRWCVAEELAQRIGAVTSEDIRSVLRPLWLHDELFVCIDHHRPKMGEPQDSSTMIHGSCRGIDLPKPTFMWLLGEIFPDVEEIVDVPEATISDAVIVAPKDAGVDRVADVAVMPRMRRKETKLAKKQRAVQSRAVARTLAEDMATQEAVKKELVQASKTGKLRTKKGMRGAKITSFA
jgi:hypothetical protein